METAKREKEKTIILDGRTFVIKKFDAFTGSYVAFVLTSKLLPMGLSSQLSGLGAPQPGTASIEMSKKEFFELQKDCLGICYEQVNADLTIPILNENGSFRALGLENDVKTVLALTVQAIVFNVQGFFGESLSMESFKNLFNSNRSDAQTSTSSSTDQ